MVFLSSLAHLVASQFKHNSQLFSNILSSTLKESYAPSFVRLNVILRTCNQSLALI